MADSESGGTHKPGISESNFYQLLKDRIFVDYFNVFLCLPVFNQRVFYKYASEDFEFDPPLQLTTPNVRLDKSRTLSWLYETRLPAFLKTDIYLEYRLCRQLLRSFFQRASKDKPKFTDCSMGEDEVEDVIGHVLGMRQFRKYLSDGPGSRLLRLWLDVERFLRLAPGDRLTRWMSYRELQVTFCDFDRRPDESCPADDDDGDGDGDYPAAPSSDDSPCVVLDGEGFIEVDSFTTVPSPTLSKRAVDRFLIETYSVSREDLSSEQHPSARIPTENLRTLQNILVQVLGSYWLPKFLIHRQTLDWLQANVKRMRPIKSGEGGGGGGGGGGLGYKEQEDSPISTAKLVNEMKKNMAEKSSSGKRHPIKDDVVDNTFLASRDANEVLTMRSEGVVTLSPIDPTISTRVKITTAVRQAVETYLPQTQIESENLPISHSVSTFSASSMGSRTPSAAAGTSSSDCASSASFASASASASPVPSQRSFRMTPASTAARKLNKLTGVQEQVKTTEQEKEDREAVLNSSIDRIRQKTVTCRDLSNFAVASRPSTSSIARLRPPGLLPVSCPRPSRPDLVVSPSETSDRAAAADYRFDHRLYLRGIVTDRLAGGPFELFLAEHGCPEARAILGFWTDSQVYLSCRRASPTSVQSYIRCRRAKSLIMRYLTGQADRRICVLAPTLRYSLQRHLAIGKGEELMRRAQDAAIEFLRPMWESFLQSDSIQFENYTVSMRRDSSGLKLKTITTKATTKLLYSDGDNFFAAEQRRCSPRPIEDGKDKETQDRLSKEQSRFYEAQRRTELALQFAIDMSRFCVDGLMIDSYPESDIKFYQDIDYGSLGVKKFAIVRRPDIETEMAKRRMLDRLDWEKKKKGEGEGEEDEDDLSAKSSIRRFMKDGKVMERPPRPATCVEIFEDPVQLEFFKRYLVAKKAETPLLFFIDVEELMLTEDQTKRTQMVQNILHKYFKDIKSVKMLSCDAKILEEMYYLPREVTPERLLLAQSAVQHCLMDEWCDKYMSILEEEDNAREAERKNRISDLWQKLLKNLVKFRLMLTDEENFQEFENFVVQQSAKEHADGKTYLIKTAAKEAIKVDLTKLNNDIRFMRDMEKFRILSDQVKKLQKADRMKPEHLEMIRTEAEKIRNTYLPPGKEPIVNISPGVARALAGDLNLDELGRSTFHDATIETYQIAYQWWKKFTAIHGKNDSFWEKIAAMTAKPGRKKGKKPRDTLVDPLGRTSSGSKRKGKLDSVSTKEGSKMGEGRETGKRTDPFTMKQTLNFDDGRVHIVFGILNGLRLFIPRSLKHDDDSPPHPTDTEPPTQLMPGVYQMFYTLPSVQTNGRVADGVYDKLQDQRKTNFLRSPEATTFPIFVIDGTTYVLVSDSRTASVKRTASTKKSSAASNGRRSVA